MPVGAFRRFVCSWFAVPAAAFLAWAPGYGSEIVVSQIYGGGGNSGATYRNDFVELFNRSSNTISVAGWSVQYGSADGSTWQSAPLNGTLVSPSTGRSLCKQNFNQRPALNPNSEVERAPGARLSPAAARWEGESVENF